MSQTAESDTCIRIRRKEERKYNRAVPTVVLSTHGIRGNDYVPSFSLDAKLENLIMKAVHRSAKFLLENFDAITRLRLFF